MINYSEQRDIFVEDTIKERISINITIKMRELLTSIEKLEKNIESEDTKYECLAELRTEIIDNIFVN